MSARGFAHRAWRDGCFSSTVRSSVARWSTTCSSDGGSSGFRLG